MHHNTPEITGGLTNLIGTDYSSIKAVLQASTEPLHQNSKFWGLYAPELRPIYEVRCSGGL